MFEFLTVHPAHWRWPSRVACATRSTKGKQESAAVNAVLTSFGAQSGMVPVCNHQQQGLIRLAALTPGNKVGFFVILGCGILETRRDLIYGAHGETGENTQGLVRRIRHTERVACYRLVGSRAKLGGCLPNSESTPEEVAKMLQTKVPPDLAKVIARSVAFDESQRFENVQALISRLNEIVAGNPRLQNL